MVYTIIWQRFLRRSGTTHYISLDMEWSQPFSQNSIKERNGTALHGEIIQIGAVKLNRWLRAVDKFEINLKPEVYKHIHKHIASITRIDTKTARNGTDAAEALESFISWCGKDFSFITWGYEDIKILSENLAFRGFPLEYIPEKNYDLQLVFDYLTQKTGRQYSLDYAMDFYGIKETLKRHNAFNDAYYTALVCKKMKPKRYFKHYRDVEIKRLSYCDEKEFEGFVKDIELFEDLNIKAVAEKISGEPVICPECKRPAASILKYKQSDLKYAVMCKCTFHGRFLSLLKLFPVAELNVVKVVRNTYRPGNEANKNMRLKSKAWKWKVIENNGYRKTSIK